MSDDFSKLLNTAPLPVADEVAIEGELVESQKDLMIDSYDKAQQEYENVQKNLNEIVEIARGSIDDAATLASSSQDAKYYTALSQLLNSFVSANKELALLIKAKNEISNPYIEQAPKETTKVTNNLFVGSTAELLAMLKGKVDNDNTSGS